MVVPDEEAFVSDLKSAAGESLRSVATYDENGYDFLYLREELTDRADDIAADVHENLVLEGIGKEYLEDLFDAGALRCTLHEFEEMRAYHFVTGEFEGLFVGVDTVPAVETATIRSVVYDHRSDRSG